MPDPKKPDPKPEPVFAPVPAAPSGTPAPVAPEQPEPPPGSPPPVIPPGFATPVRPPQPAPATTGEVTAAAEVVWAKDLLRELKKSGTGEDKLVIVKDAIKARFDHPAHAAKPKDHSDRHLSAEEGLAALEAANTPVDPTKPVSDTNPLTHAVGVVTLAKARALVEDGKYTPPRGDRHEADDIDPPADVRPPKGKGK